MDVGRTLRRRRETLGYTLEDVRAATKIRLRYLQAIEDERRDQLPAPVYTRGFIRSYAGFLDLDGAALAAEWAQANAPETPDGEGAPSAPAAAPPPAVAPKPADSGPRLAPSARPAARPERAPRPDLGRRRRPIAALWAIALVAIVAAVYTWQAADHGKAVATAARTGTALARSATATASTHSAAATVPTARKPPAPSLTTGAATSSASGPLLTYRVAGASSLTVVATASARCWVRVWLDGSATYTDQTLSPGQSATWRAQRQVTLRIGYPSGLQLTVDGLAVPPFHTVSPVDAALVLAAPTP